MSELMLFGLPVVIYVLVQSRPHGIGWAAAANRIGLQFGPLTSYYWALLLTMVNLGLFVVVLPLLPADRMDAVGVTFILASTFTLALGVISRAVLEELFFRGLVFGVLLPRLGYWWGNLIQSTIFLLPHLILLTVDPGFWPLLPVQFASGWLAGWLRQRSGSLLPGALTHVLVNLLSPVLVLWLLG
ncbi:lysostaphin resistance A-like protein [Corynebacterium sp. A21]|uniref:lysostaphin resistance A-like protein n=1 Tax=Corynebacterium sp. A21 TaxID=3457318 RepID=UPI003FD3C380